MKSLLSSIFFLILANTCLLAQTINKELNNDSVDSQDEMVEFIGGTDSLQAYLENNLKYPEIALNAGIECVVQVTFVVNRDSTVEIRDVSDCSDSLLISEAKRLILSTNKLWIPGKHNGKPIRSLCKIPVVFELEAVETIIYNEVDKLPKYMGEFPISEYIKKNLNHSVTTADTSSVNKVAVSFVVNTDGTILEIKVKDAYNVSSETAIEVVRLIGTTQGQWKPAFKGRRPVRYRMTIIIDLN